MRWARVLGTLALASAYGTGALYFYRQARWAQSYLKTPLPPPPAPVHPEGLAALVRDAFVDNDYSDAVGAWIRESLRQAPSSFQPPFFLAVFHASRLTRPDQVERGFDAALERYPANGRLRLEHARWLLSPEAAAHSALAMAELEEALRLEPELIGQGVSLLKNHGVPLEEWSEILPRTQAAKEKMVYALVELGHEEEALSILRDWMRAPEARSYYSRATRWALAWGDPALAVEIADRWQAVEAQGALSPPRRGWGPDATEVVFLGEEPFDAGLLKAVAQLQMGSLDAAYDTFRTTLGAIEKRFGSGSLPATRLLCAMGYEYLNRGQAVLAQSLFGEAFAHAPRNADVALGLARSFVRSGDVASALDHYRRALELSPSSDAARQELAALSLKAP